jgi:hypothetical protein
MRKYFLLATVLAIVVTACQKEIDWGLGDAANQQLLKIRSISGSDSTIITYTYDGQKLLILETTEGSSGGNSLNGTLKIYRKTSGIIDSTVQKSAALVTAGIDSILTKYYYNTSNSRYTAATRLVDVGGFTVTDSAAYSYDAGGKISLEKHYLVTGLLPPFEALENQYTYSASGSNLVTMAQSAVSAPGGPLAPVSTENYSFDTKTDPLLLKNEAVLLGRLTYFSANNPTKTDYIDQTDPTQNFTINLTYKYNMGGKPDSSFATQIPAGTVTNSKYYYQ